MTIVHEFEPVEEDHDEDVFIRARCSCGWEGGAHPRWEEGYQEAEDEFAEHESGEWGEEEPR